MTQDINATSPDTDFHRADNGLGEASSHGTECSPAHRATPVEAGVSKQVHADLVLELNCVRETLDQTQSALEAVQTNLQMMEQHQPRLEGQLDVLIRMMQPETLSLFSARAPSRSRGSDPDMD